MDSRQNADLCGERADLVLGATVDAKALLEHVLADGLDLERIEEMHETDGIHLGPLLGDLLEQVFLDGGNLALALELALYEKRGRESLAALLAHEVHLVRRLRNIDDDLVGLAEGAAHLDLEIDDLLDLFMGALESRDEILVADLGRGTFHHQELAANAGVEEIDVALGLLLMGRVDHPLPVDAADAHAADRAHERNLGDVKRGGRRVDGEEVGLARTVALDERRVHLDVVVVSVGEERTDRTVAHAGREDLLARRARLALEEAAGELARGVELLAILALQGEEVYPLARRIRICDRREDGRVTV